MPSAKTDLWLGMPTDSSQARDKREISFQVFLSILSVVSEQRWQSHLTKRDSPTTKSPELFFWFNPSWKDSESNIEINVDAVSRVLDKLVANAIEATIEGMVRIEVSLQDVKINKVIENVPLKAIKLDEAKPRKVKKTHILTIKVYDTGHGMSKSFLAHQIFEAYQKEDLDSPGIGLSLALCRSTDYNR